jgi:predicted Zn-dependent peptidase
MMRFLTSAALVLAGTAAVASPLYPTTRTIDLGAAKLYSQYDDAVSVAGVQIFVPAGLERQTSAQNGIAALTAQSVLQLPVDGVALRDAIAARGGSLSYAIGLQYTRFYVEASPGVLPDVLALLGKALVTPTFTNAAVAPAKTELLGRIAEDERNPVSVGIGMFRSSYYIGGANLPTYGNAGNVANLTSADVAAFYTEHYRRTGTVLSAVGALGDAVTKGTSAIVAALPDGPSPALTIKTKPLAAAPRRIITHRDFGAPWLVLGFAAPSAGDRDFGAMLVLQAFIGDVFDRASATTIPALERPIGSVYSYDSKPATLSLYINGGQIDPSVGLRAVDAILKSLALKPLNKRIVARYKAMARGAFLTDAITLDDRSWRIGNFVEHGLSPDYAEAALAALDRATPADVQRIAKSYMQRYTIAVILPREGAPAAAKPAASH